MLGLVGFACQSGERNTRERLKSSRRSWPRSEQPSLVKLLLLQTERPCPLAFILETHTATHAAWSLAGTQGQL